MEGISDKSFKIQIEVMEGFFKLSRRFKLMFKAMLFETTF